MNLCENSSLNRIGIIGILFLKNAMQIDLHSLYTLQLTNSEVIKRFWQHIHIKKYTFVLLTVQLRSSTAITIIIQQLVRQSGGTVMRNILVINQCLGLVC